MDYTLPSHYDKASHLKLLKKKQSIGFLNQSDPELLELVFYESCVENQFLFNNIDQYLKVLKSYLDSKTGPIYVEFQVARLNIDLGDQFVELINDSSKLESFTVSVETDEITSIIQDLFDGCENMQISGDSDSGVSNMKVGPDFDYETWYTQAEFREFVFQIYNRLISLGSI